MVRENINSLLEQAFESSLGIAINTPSYLEACALRRKLYAHRDRLRRDGNMQFAELSFIAKKNGELLIVKRCQQQAVPVRYNVRELANSEYPRKIIVRGKKKIGLLNEMALKSFLENSVPIDFSGICP